MTHCSSTSVVLFVLVFVFVFVLFVFVVKLGVGGWFDDVAVLWRCSGGCGGKVGNMYEGVEGAGAPGVCGEGCGRHASPTRRHPATTAVRTDSFVWSSRTHSAES